MACGAGLPLLALFVTGAQFLVVYGYTAIARRIPSKRPDLHVRYSPGKGAVEKLMQMCVGRGFLIQELAVEGNAGATETEIRSIHLQLRGRRGIEALLVAIEDIKGVVAVKMAPAQDGKE
jgi:putative Mg2+ transporter-C (MgtC) family protein